MPISSAVVIAIPDAKIAELEDRLPGLEKAMGYTLADAIREGATVTGQAVGAWTTMAGEMCALSAAALALKARHMLSETAEHRLSHR